MLREGLHGKAAAVGQALDLVDRGEVALAQLFEGLEHLMEAQLVQLLREADVPGLDDRRAGEEAHRPGLVEEEPQPALGRSDIFLDLIDDLELEVEAEHQAASGLQSLLREGREEEGVADEGEQEMRLHVVGRVGERVFQVDGLLIERGGRELLDGRKEARQGGDLAREF